MHAEWAGKVFVHFCHAHQTTQYRQDWSFLLSCSPNYVKWAGKILSLSCSPSCTKWADQVFVVMLFPTVRNGQVRAFVYHCPDHQTMHGKWAGEISVNQSHALQTTQNGQKRPLFIAVMFTKACEVDAVGLCSSLSC